MRDPVYRSNDACGLLLVHSYLDLTDDYTMVYHASSFDRCFYFLFHIPLGVCILGIPEYNLIKANADTKATT
jgi:hypothetical protein